MWKVKKLGLLPGMTPVVPASSASFPSSPQRNTILVPRSEDVQPVKPPPIGNASEGVEEILPDGRGSRGARGVTEEARGVTEEANSSSRSQFSSEEGRFSSEEAVKEAPPTTDQRNSLRNQGDSSERMRNSSAPQTTPQDSSNTPQRNTEEALGAFAEEMKELRKTMQFVKDSPREDRPAVSELRETELPLGKLGYSLGNRGIALGICSARSLRLARASGPTLLDDDAPTVENTAGN